MSCTERDPIPAVPARPLNRPVPFRYAPEEPPWALNADLSSSYDASDAKYPPRALPAGCHPLTCPIMFWYGPRVWLHRRNFAPDARPYLDHRWDVEMGKIGDTRDYAYGQTAFRMSVKGEGTYYGVKLRRTVEDGVADANQTHDTKFQCESLSPLPFTLD